MTRNEARAAFAESGLDYSVLSVETLKTLRDLIDTEMRSSGLFQNTYRARRNQSVRDSPNGRVASVRCKAYYFEDREAVTFNADGFIGFAGWSDEQNVQPILAAFGQWVRELAPAPARASGMQSQ